MPHSLELITSLLDLTSLTGSEIPADINILCQKAQTPQGYVAAVCVYPQFIPIAKTALTTTTVKIATVINFPTGNASVEESIQAIKNALNDGTDEIDLVMPYQALKQQQHDFVLTYLQNCRHACAHHCLKIIIESGELSTKEIAQASDLVIAAKADFIKTSTGKTQQGATLNAAEIILQTIVKAQQPIGIKFSGGIRTLAQANDYLDLVVAYLGKEWISTNSVRFGTSRLLSD